MEISSIMMIDNWRKKLLVSHEWQQACIFCMRYKKLTEGLGNLLNELFSIPVHRINQKKV